VCAALVAVLALMSAGDRIVADQQSPLARISQSTAQTGTDDSTFWTRIAAYDAAWQVIRRQPFVGVGLDPKDTPTATGDEVHNVFMRPWYEAGLLGFAGVLLVYLAVGAASWRTLAAARSPRDAQLAVALWTSYIAFVAWGMSEAAMFKRYGWIAGALVLALRAQQLREGAVQAAAPAATERARRAGASSFAQRLGNRPTLST
jgi:O-antigen ligase